MPDDERHDRRRVVALILGLLFLGGLIGAIVVLLVTDEAGNESADTVTKTRVAPDAAAGTGASTAPPASATSGPPCSAAAILPALQAFDSTITSVAGFVCGGGWAGTSYETPNFASAALLKAQGNTWVNVDRGANCNDASIPVNVHHFCEVS